MSEISADITGLHWLNPVETPLDAIVKGAQAGAAISQAMSQRQALSMQAAKLPFEIQGLQTRNALQSEQVTEQWLQNTQTKAESEAWMKDMTAPENQAFWNETNPDKVLTMDQPATTSIKGQNAAQARLRMASESQLAQSYQKRATEDNLISAKLIENGGTSTWGKDQMGRPMLDRDAATAEFKRLGVETQTDKEALARIRPTIMGQTAENVAGIRQETAIITTGMKNDTQVAIAKYKESLDNAESAANRIQDRAMLATYLRQLDVIKLDGLMDAGQKQAAIMKLGRQYNLGTIGFPDRATAAPAGDQTNPKSGLHVAPAATGTNFLGTWDPVKRAWVR